MSQLQTKLTWLDLSFNQIQKIEGLETLVDLTDLSLQDNVITDLEGLANLKKLQCLSLGTYFNPMLLHPLCVRHRPLRLLFYIAHSFEA